MCQRSSPSTPTLRSVKHIFAMAGIVRSVKHILLPWLEMLGQ